MLPLDGRKLTKLSYRPEIDGLRAVAVIAVMIFHAFPAYLRGGFVGVDLFFFISGFLISSIIFRSLEQKKFSFVLFYSSRIKRIFPALILILLSCYIVAWFSLFPDEYRLLGKHIFGSIFFVDNFLLWRESGYFDQAAELKPLLHVWSLSIEEQFYLLFPVFIWFLWRSSLKILLLALIIITFLSFGMNINSITSHADGAFFFPHTRIWELLFGSIFAYVTIFYQEKAQVFLKQNLPGLKFFASKLPQGRGYKHTCSIAGISLLIIGFLMIQQDYSFPGFWPLLPLSGAALLISSGPNAWCNRYFLMHPIMVWIGLISYPLYLWHWPILSFLRITHANVPSSFILWGALALSFVLAWLTYIFFERPIRFGVISKLKIPLLCLIAVIVSCLGYMMYVGKLQPRSAKLESISDLVQASTEEGFPDGLTPFRVNKNTVGYRIGGQEKITLFWGDSNMQQYSSRVVEVFNKKKSGGRGAVFLAEGGCPPFFWKKQRGSSRCDNVVNAFLKLAKNDHIDTIVVSALWFGYFRPDLFNTENPNLKLEPLEDIVSMQNSLKTIFKSVTRPGRKIYLVLSIPRGYQVNPKSYIKRGLFEMQVLSSPIAPLNQTEFIAKHKEAYALIKNIAKEFNILVIDPLNFLCENNQCSAFDLDGKAKYADETHLRPSYVRRNVRYIDRTITDATS